VCSYALPKSVNFTLCKNSFVCYTLIALGLQISLKMLQTSFSLNELTYGLKEVEWGLVLVCTIGVHPFSKGKNYVLSCTFKICQFYFVQKLIRRLHLNYSWIAT